MRNIKSKTLDFISEVMTAYSDCNGHKGERNLKFMASRSVSAIEIINLMRAAVPEGYNMFEADKSIPLIVDIFGDDAEYFAAREGSVCIYIKPKSNLWMNGHRSVSKKFSKIDADEFCFCPEKQMFRAWWD